LSDVELDDVDRRLAGALLDDGRGFAGRTVYRGHVALRPAICSGETTAADLDCSSASSAAPCVVS
jgi:hypothetical protein